MLAPAVGLGDAAQRVRQYHPGVVQGGQELSQGQALGEPDGAVVGLVVADLGDPPPGDDHADERRRPGDPHRGLPASHDQLSSRSRISTSVLAISWWVVDESDRWLL